MNRRPLLFSIACANVLMLGCSKAPPAWHDDPQSATVGYWADQPATAKAQGEDYQSLWSAADKARRRFGFEAAMTDYRGGLLTTEPKISPQFLEIWHDELRTASAMTESSLATMRRRLRFEFSRLPGGGYAVEPKVIVERLSLAERRITSAIDYRGTLGPGQQHQFGPAVPEAPGKYWYAVGRDAQLEAALADHIRAQLR